MALKDFNIDRVKQHISVLDKYEYEIGRAHV